MNCRPPGSDRGVSRRCSPTTVATTPPGRELRPDRRWRARHPAPTEQIARRSLVRRACPVVARANRGAAYPRGDSRSWPSGQHNSSATNWRSARSESAAPLSNGPPPGGFGAALPERHPNASGPGRWPSSARTLPSRPQPDGTSAGRPPPPASAPSTTPSTAAVFNVRTFNPPIGAEACDPAGGHRQRQRARRRCRIGLRVVWRPRMETTYVHIDSSKRLG